MCTQHVVNLKIKDKMHYNKSIPLNPKLAATQTHVHVLQWMHLGVNKNNTKVGVLVSLLNPYQGTSYCQLRDP